MIFSIDGYIWKYGCTVERTAEMTPSEISGLLLNKNYFADILGTYMMYDVRIEVPIGRENEYVSIYEQLTKPIANHECVLPYNGGTVKVVGRIENIKDVYVRIPIRKRNKITYETHWKGIQFSIIANNPTKRVKLGDVISVGFPALPQTDVDIGAVYIYSSGGWKEIDDAEDGMY